MTTLVLPGSYDPVTLGHVAVIDAARRLGPRVLVVVGVNAAKSCLFTAAQRVQLLRGALADRDGVEVTAWDGLVVDLCRRLGDAVLVKGIRSPLDASAEAAQAQVNRQLADVETVWIPAPGALAHVSSTIVKDVARHGGDVGALVPPNVEQALLNRFAASARPHEGDPQ